MPKFFYTMIVVNLIIWIYWLKLFFGVEPANNGKLIEFLVVFFVALTLTVSFPMYLYMHKRAAKHTNLKKIYRESLKWAAYYAVGLVAIMTMRAYDVMNLTNTVLFGLLYVSLFSTINGRKK